MASAERLGYKIQVSSVRSNRQRRDGPGGHDGGKAIDLDGVNGSPVGMNATTWKFIVDMIDHGGAEGIGTIPEIANNAEMQAHARAAGVRLFVDAGTGAHIHIQVR